MSELLAWAKLFSYVSHIWGTIERRKTADVERVVRIFEATLPSFLVGELAYSYNLRGVPGMLLFLCPVPHSLPLSSCHLWLFMLRIYIQTTQKFTMAGMHTQNIPTEVSLKWSQSSPPKLNSLADFMRRPYFFKNLHLKSSPLIFSLHWNFMALSFLFLLFSLSLMNCPLLLILFTCECIKWFSTPSSLWIKTLFRMSELII